MSFPRLAILVLPIVFGLPLLTGACGAPAAAVATSYGADGVSVVDSGKTVSDHFASMVSKKDCALWRVLRGRNVCYEREGDRDPYQVNYNEAFRDQSEGGGVEFHAPLRAEPNAPVTTSDSAAYKPAPAPATPAQPVTAVADAKPTAEPAVAPAPSSPKVKKAKGDQSAAKKKAKKPKPSADPKPSPDQAVAGL